MVPEVKEIIVKTIITTFKINTIVLLHLWNNKIPISNILHNWDIINNDHQEVSWFQTFKIIWIEHNRYWIKITFQRVIWGLQCPVEFRKEIKHNQIFKLDHQVECKNNLSQCNFYRTLIQVNLYCNLVLVRDIKMDEL